MGCTRDFVGLKPVYTVVFKRNVNAFSLNAIVDVRLRRRRRHEMIFVGRSPKLFKLATSKFNTR